MEANRLLDRYGVVVIKSHFIPQVSDEWFESIRRWLINISGGGLTEDEKTWTYHNLPYGPRKGMMQSLISHCPTIWQIREAFYPLYKELLNEEKLYCSIDGATVHPYIAHDDTDWPHIDQTMLNLRCIQGQVVLTNTTASFRCTPESNLKHQEILDLFSKRNHHSNWLPFNDTKVKLLKDKFNFERWQIPIHAPKGSVIFWKSNTIHSAKKNDAGDKTWRCVVYVSMRSMNEYTEEDKQTLTKAAKEGLTTNHWGNHIFAKKPRFAHKPNPTLSNLWEHPELIIMPKKDWSPLLLKLTAQKSW